MIDYLAAQVGLGLAGFDPIGALLAGGALAAGASRRAVLAFAASCLVLTLALGASFSFVLGPLLSRLSESFQIADRWWLLIELVVAAVLCVWGIRRLRSGAADRRGDESRRAARGVGVTAMTISGGLWGVAAATDPTFYAAALLAGRHDLVVMLLGITLWYAVSQLPLHVLTGAVVAGKHRRATEWIGTTTRRWSAPVRRTITGLAFAGAVLLVADVTVFVVTGAFLIG